MPYHGIVNSGTTSSCATASQLSSHSGREDTNGEHIVHANSNGDTLPSADVLRCVTVDVAIVFGEQLVF
jgi:hypothetical protein